MILPSLPTIFICCALLLRYGAESNFLMHLDLSDDYRERIVDAHNSNRRIPDAINMKEISYDLDLEESAKEYSRQCKFAHDSNRGDMGENLYVGGESYSLIVGTAIEKWYEEVKYYSYNTSTCDSGEQCGHYWQIVWADTERVGCVITSCSANAGLAFQGTRFVICRYSPAGNVAVNGVVKRPYIAGSPPCSGCSSDTYECVDDLCREREAETTSVIPTTIPDEITTPARTTASPITIEDFGSTTAGGDLKITTDPVTTPTTTSRTTANITTTESIESTPPDVQTTPSTTSCPTPPSTCSEEYIALFSEYRRLLQDWKSAFDEYVSSSSGDD